MSFSKFKLNAMKKTGSVGGLRAIFRLTNLKVVEESEIAEGAAWQCTIAPSGSGYYLPQVISITGTTSKYAFKYDYTTGVIYIPSGEITKNNIIITAVADTKNNNVPAVLDIEMIKSNTYHGGDVLSNETFALINVYPCRGSTVSITYGGVTKTVTGTLSTDQYESAGQLIAFGTFAGVADGTPTSGQMTITGAYEAYGGATFSQSSKTTGVECDCITGISNVGSIRYLPADFATTKQFTATFDNALDFIAKGAVGQGSAYLTFNKLPKTVNGLITSNGDNSSAYLYFNGISWNEWASGDRTYLSYYTYHNESSGNDTAVKPYYNGVFFENVTNVSLSEGLLTIGNYAFNCFYGLISINIPSSVTRIGDYAFNACFELASITIPNSVTTIGDYAFKDCNDLTSITIPNSVTTIGAHAFSYCHGLTTINIPSSVTSIGDYAFNNLNQLTTITVDPGNSNFYSSNSNCIIRRSDNKLLCGCNSSTIPNSVTSIGDYAFISCDGLTTINIPSSVTSIGAHAFDYCGGLISVIISGAITSIGAHTFYHCENLTSINIPSSVTSIGEYAFYSCNKLTSITIPNSVTSIGGYAFAQCKKLATISILATTPPSIVSSTFTKSYLSAIIVPKGCGEIYKTASDNWSTYADYIVEAS